MSDRGRKAWVYYLEGDPHISHICTGGNPTEGVFLTTAERAEERREIFNEALELAAETACTKMPCGKIEDMDCDSDGGSEACPVFYIRTLKRST